MSSYLSPRVTEAESLPAAVGAELALLEARLGQFAGMEARRTLAELGEAGAVRVLRKIAESRTPVKTLSGFISFMAAKERMERNARGIPPAESRICSSAPSLRDESVSWPRYHSEDDQIDAHNSYGEEITLRFSNHGRVEAGSPAQDNQGSVGEIAHVVPNPGRMQANNPSGMILLRNQDGTQINSPIHAMTSAMMLRNQDGTQINSPVQAMTSAMMPVSTLPWMAGENPSHWISLLNLDYTHVSAMAPLVSNQVHMQINSPIRAVSPDVMMQIDGPDHHVPIGMQNRTGMGSPKTNIIHAPPRYVSTPSPVRDLSRHVQRMVFPSRSPQSPACGMWPSSATYRATCNALREKASPQLLALEELEFRKIFMIYAYLSTNTLENELSVDYIRYLKSLSMVHFESEIWSKFGRRYISPLDRAKKLDSDPGTASVYHCNVEIRGDSVVKIFKGPYIDNARTHLQKVVGDENVLLVKFMGESSDLKTVLRTYFLPYHKVAEDGIILGLRHYQFFLYKDGGKDEKKKEDKRNEKNKKCSSAVRCYFVRIKSGWNMDEPYILSGKTIGEARNLFMHIHTAPNLAKYIARFALILSKTVTLGVDLSAVHVIQLDDKPCSDEHGSIVHRDGEPMIHTDGTGLISEDLARKCPVIVSRPNVLKLQDVAACDKTLDMSPSSKRHRSITTEPPLLMQFRMFYKGSAVKGTVLVDRRLPPGTILVRPSMIKIKSDPKLCGVQSINSSELIKLKTDPVLYDVQSVNSLEIVTISNPSKRTLTSKNLIALLHYGGVKAEYFMELLDNAIEDAENARYDCDNALNIAFIYADMDDSISVRMILSGIPLEEAYLQDKLSLFSRLEREGIKKGKLPVDDCFYLMGTTDPTGKLGPNEVCVILDKGQYSGNVLVYRNPGIHFGDIHILTARYCEDIGNVIGYSKFAILFPTCGPRSLGDEMAGGDYDGDMYWVSINKKLLQQFKPSEPWVQPTKPKEPQQNFDESQLERQLFHEFLKTRFTPSYALSSAADCWLAYMDRLLTEGVDEEEKKLLEEKIKKLIDLYYWALDAPKKGIKINIPKDLMKKEYPHFMEKGDSYNSTSILGRIYDAAKKSTSQKSKNDEPIMLDPLFTEREASLEHIDLWKCRYEEYLADSRSLMDLQNKEEQDIKFEGLYLRYKHMLYYAAEFEQSPRNHDDVFNEACAIYQIVYKKASITKSVGRCGFVWKVAGHALCHFYALGSEGKKVLVPMSVARKFLKKGGR